MVRWNATVGRVAKRLLVMLAALELSLVGREASAHQPPMGEGKSEVASIDEDG
jgi:hypothetical protein